MTPVPDNSIHRNQGEALRQAWLAKEDQHCTHQHVGIERTESGYATGFYVCKQCGAQPRYGAPPTKKRGIDRRSSSLRLTAAFLSGALIGAMFTAFVNPEAGSTVRQRLYRGVRNLRTEVPQLISDSRDAYGALAKDARQTFRQTAFRLTAIITTCMDAAKKNITPP